MGPFSTAVKAANGAKRPRRSRTVHRGSSRATLRRCRARLWGARLPIALCVALGVVLLALVRDAAPELGNLTGALRDRDTPLTPESFVKLAHALANSSSPPALTDARTIASSTRRWATTRRKNVPADDWDALADDVAIAIKTGREVAHERLHRLAERGWLSTGRRVPNLLVVADEAMPTLGVIDIKRYALDVVVGALRNGSSTHPLPQRWFERRGWRGDKDKNLPTLHLLRRTFPNAKWYVLLDDDTYLLLDNFARYMLAAPPDRPVYTGKVFYISNCGQFTRNGEPRQGSGIHSKGLFAHGGAGIFINRQAMDAIYPVVGRCVRQYSSCWAGDMQVGLCMNAHGVQVHNFKHGHSHEYMFTPFSLSRAMADSRYTRRLKSSLEPVTFHKIAEAEARLVAEFDAKCAREGKPVTYRSLRVYLQAHGIQPTFGWRKTRYDTNVFMPKR